MSRMKWYWNWYSHSMLDALSPTNNLEKRSTWMECQSQVQHLIHIRNTPTHLGILWQWYGCFMYFSRVFMEKHYRCTNKSWSNFYHCFILHVQKFILNELPRKQKHKERTYCYSFFNIDYSTYSSHAPKCFSESPLNKFFL